MSTASMHLPVPTHDKIVPVRSADVVRYLEVLENDFVSIGVFVLPPGGKIPLHGKWRRGNAMIGMGHQKRRIGGFSVFCGCFCLLGLSGFSCTRLFRLSGCRLLFADHPFMCVASKVLYGTLHVRCFDPVEEILTGVFTARETRRDTFHSGDITMLFPNHCNIHSFEAGPEGCAVLDILLPPYDASQGRLCSYYADFTYPIDPSLMVLSPIIPPER